MIADLPSYPEYRDSGVRWLGGVPDHWEVVRTRYLLREIDQRSPDGTETHLSMSQKLGLVPTSMVEQRTLVSESYAGGKLCEEDDIVLNRLKAHLGVFALAPQNGVISPDYTVLRKTRPMTVKYFEQVLKSPACRSEFRVRAKGIVEGFWRLYTDDLYDIRLPVPPVAEQAGIVRFLDHADQRIRRYIAAKKRLIALLNEQRQGIIDSAVTRGVSRSETCQELGSAPSMRVSAAWNIARLWAVASIRSEKNRPDLDLLSVFLGRGVIPYDQGGGQVHKPSLELSGYQVVHPGDLVLNNQQAWRGSVGVSKYHGIVSPAYVVLRLDPALDPRFASYLFPSRPMVAQFVTSSKGVGDIQRDIHVPWLKNARIPIPPPQEQVAIADHLDRQLADLEMQGRLADREVDLLEEYRTRLISDVVTGKLDVREAAAQLPDEIEGAEALDAMGDLTEGNEFEDEADLDAAVEEVVT